MEENMFLKAIKSFEAGEVMPPVNSIVQQEGFYISLFEFKMGLNVFQKEGIIDENLIKSPDLLDLHNYRDSLSFVLWLHNLGLLEILNYRDNALGFRYVLDILKKNQWVIDFLEDYKKTVKLYKNNYTKVFGGLQDIYYLLFLIHKGIYSEVNKYNYFKMLCSVTNKDNSVTNSLSSSIFNGLTYMDISDGFISSVAYLEKGKNKEFSKVEEKYSELISMDTNLDNIQISKIRTSNAFLSIQFNKLLLNLRDKDYYDEEEFDLLLQTKKFMSAVEDFKGAINDKFDSFISFSNYEELFYMLYKDTFGQSSVFSPRGRYNIETKEEYLKFEDMAIHRGVLMSDWLLSLKKRKVKKNEVWEIGETPNVVTKYGFVQYLIQTKKNYVLYDTQLNDFVIDVYSSEKPHLIEVLNLSDLFSSISDYKKDELIKKNSNIVINRLTKKKFISISVDTIFDFCYA